MKCSNPDCNRGIGLVAYRRGWFSKRRYCSKHCRDAFGADAPNLQQKRSPLSFIGGGSKEVSRVRFSRELVPDLAWLTGINLARPRSVPTELNND
jgi:hypothetical protein